MLSLARTAGFGDRERFPKHRGSNSSAKGGLEESAGGTAVGRLSLAAHAGG